MILNISRLVSYGIHEKLISGESFDVSEVTVGFWMEQLRDHTFMMSTQKGGREVMKFCTCLWILLFLNNRSIVYFCGWWGWGGKGGGQKICNFLWT